MRSYSIRYAQDDFGPAEEFDLDAVDGHQLFAIVGGRDQRRTAEIWCNGVQLCTLRRAWPMTELWEINGPRPLPRTNSGHG